MYKQLSIFNFFRLNQIPKTINAMNVSSNFLLGPWFPQHNKIRVVTSWHVLQDVYVKFCSRNF